jgi:hypothetical protein
MDETSPFITYCKCLLDFVTIEDPVADELRSVHDKSVRYVAAENIEPVGTDTLPSAAMMKLAGRHFKRWDGASHTFVSNLRDEYPDD